MTDEVITPHLPKGAGRWLPVVVFVAGAALMSFELVGSRILAPFFGNSIYVWGSLIGVFLAALSVGYFVGGRVADRFPHAGALAGVLALSAVLTALVVLVSDPLQSAVVRWNPGIRLNPLISAVALFGPASILMGMVSPFAVRLMASDLLRVGSTAGALYGLSTLGSIVGTIGTSFWLVGTIGTQSVVLLVAAALAGCAVLAAVAAAGGRALAASVVAGLLVLVLAGTGAARSDGTLSVRTGTNSPVLKAAGFREEFKPDARAGTERLREDSQYHRIRVVDYPQGVEPERGPARLLHFDNSMQAAIELDEQGNPDPDAPPVFSYLAAVDMLPILRPDAKRMLFIGLGSGAAPMRAHQLMPDAEIDVVEIDPEVVDVAREWFEYDDKGKQIETHVGDGRSWLAASDTKYDVIMVDAYYADSIPFHLTTREFLDVVEDHLTKDGLVYANMIGAVEGRRSSLLRSFVKTYEARFDDVEIYPVSVTEDPPELDRFSNVELFASDSGGLEADLGPAASAAAPDAPDADQAVEALTGVRGHPALARLLEDRYTGDLDLGDVPVLTDDYAPVDALSIHEEDA